MRRLGCLAACVGAAIALLGGIAAAPHPGAAPCELLAPGFQRATSRTSRCLGCHDGSVGRTISTHSPSHPVDRSYAQALSSRRASLRPFPRAELVLVDGRVVCATCHDGASPHPRHTAVATAVLCEGCHAL